MMGLSSCDRVKAKVKDILREHAPQALMRFGFQAFVGGSFAEIFAGNCTALGLPHLTLPAEDLVRLMDAVDLDPSQEIVVDVYHKARELVSKESEFRKRIREGISGADAVRTFGPSI